MKIVVFDLDETLGYFTQFSIFWDCLKKFVSEFYDDTISQNEFNDVLDLYPEFIRPNIFTILNYLKNKKKSFCCNKIMIYTNNSGPKEWANHIKSYFETKIRYSLVDQVISAFKINGKVIEVCRTTQNKTHDDLIKCTKIPLNTEICFLDDTFYSGMVNDNIYYINLKPYFHNIEFDDMIKFFQDSDIGKKIIQNKKEEFNTFMKETIKKYNYEYIPKSDDEHQIDEIVGKHILSHLKIFFNDNKIKTKKNIMSKVLKKTRRKY